MTNIKLPDLLISRVEANQRIQNQIEKGKVIEITKITDKNDVDNANDEFSIWDSFNTELLKRIFDTTEVSEEYSAYHARIVSMNPSIYEMVTGFQKKVQRKINKLKSIQERLSLYNEISSNKINDSETSNEIKSNRIFIVHGKDEAAKQSVARFIEKLGLIPVILHEQPNGGNTIIEKFERDSDVNYAVVLLTPDDVGDMNSDNPGLSFRARQNVIFELGYFIGKLGRKHVCALYKGNVELPSDFDGMLYILFDDEGAWKFILSKELKTDGFDIDLNRLC